VHKCSLPRPRRRRDPQSSCQQPGCTPDIRVPLASL
jgi:hypothetical protein